MRGFALLARHFEESDVPKVLPRYLPDDWKGAFALLAIYPLVAGQFGVDLVAKIMIYAIFALSLELLVGSTGLVCFGHAALFGIDDDTHLHVSLDVDFLDPDIAPGVATTVAGGPTYREAQLCMEMVADTGRLASLDIVELNPAFDVRNRTAALAVDLVESLFGKSTLMRERG